MNIVNKATVNSEHETKFYIGWFSTQFRYAKHKKIILNEAYMKMILSFQSMVIA